MTHYKYKLRNPEGLSPHKKLINKAEEHTQDLFLTVKLPVTLYWQCVEIMYHLLTSRALR